jgi:hypothetical protein
MMLQPRGAGRQWPTLEFVYAEYENKCSRLNYAARHTIDMDDSLWKIMEMSFYDYVGSTSAYVFFRICRVFHSEDYPLLRTWMCLTPATPL